MNFDTSTLVVGQQVGIVRPGSWSNHGEGVYLVTKVNKKVIVVNRESDGHERTFSAKFGTEMGATTKYRAPYLESVSDQQERNDRIKKETSVRNAWAAVASAGESKNTLNMTTALKQLIDSGVKLTFSLSDNENVNS